jgi:tRNA A-37 threonylcarbamoyl transferase component Bud32
MAQIKLIGQPAKDTPAELQSAAGHRRRLPDDLLRQASRRLEIMSLMAAVLWVIGPVLGHLALHAMSPGDPRWAQFLTIDAIAAASVVTSLALFLYLRTGDRDPAFVMDLALVYMVAMAFAIGVLMHWGPPSATPLVVAPMITWIGPLILMFAAIVPTTPWKLLVAGFLAASMDPLGMVIGKAAGLYQLGSLSDVLVMHYPNYLLLGVAVVISHVVTRLGQQVTKEREMGSYRLGELLGRGGMGEVYRATHRMLARPAVIKLIRPEVLAVGDGATAQLAMVRFTREAEAAANLRSPHTVELYDFGVTDDRTLYMVMELLDGMDLETLVRQHGPLPAARVIHVLCQVCESLEEAHASGLVHRDIKPANIHLGRLGLRHDFVKVLDFGLVKSTAAMSGHHSLATAAGLTPGTPAYMAPEMVDDETVDGRADLYALGCVAYYLLTGRLVFEAATAFQMIARHLQDAPVPPSQRTQSPIPPALEQLVLACLAKKPADRPRSAAALARSLQAVAIEPWGEEQAMLWWQQHRDGAAKAPERAPLAAGG